MTDSAGAQRVEEIEQRHAREMESPLLGDNTHYDDIDYLLARLRTVEGDSDYWKRACAAEKARHDKSLTRLRAVKGESESRRCTLLGVRAQQVDDWKRAEVAEAEARRLRAALEKARIFIEYARYELDPGKSRLGNQFPKQDDADAEMANIDAALTPPRPAGDTG